MLLLLYSCVCSFYDYIIFFDACSIYFVMLHFIVHTVCVENIKIFSNLCSIVTLSREFMMYCIPKSLRSTIHYFVPHNTYFVISTTTHFYVILLLTLTVVMLIILPFYYSYYFTTFSNGCMENQYNATLSLLIMVYDYFLLLFIEEGIHLSRK